MKTDYNRVRINQEKAQPMPIGATVQNGGVNFVICTQGEAEFFLCLYKKGDNKPTYEFQIPPENRVGDVRYLYIDGLNPKQWEYSFYCMKLTERGEKQKSTIIDIYAKKIIGREKWGEIPQVPLRYGFLPEGFHWGQDKPPAISLEDTILYRLHTRGFTKHSSSHVKGRGTFAGIMEKIPYLKELGVTMIELMPSYEFNEVILSEQGETRLNYFGYGDAYYFAPKASYSKGKAGGRCEPANELKELVRELHQAGLEISMEFYFVPGIPMEFILDCLIFWRLEYHIDAFHVNQNGVDMTRLAKNPYLSDRKLFGNEWDTDAIYQRREPIKKRLAAMNDGFMMDMRRFLKSDENQLGAFLYRLTRNPIMEGVVNYIANHDSLTLQDMVMYERRHNEANGENNQDGNPFNYSWNCGVEGECRKKKILDCRIQQMKNALVMVFFSQGIPMLFSGDEFARTCQGNNNPYCQDNEVTWINWKWSKKGKEIYDFTKMLIAFRKEHRILHMAQQLKMMDYGAVGRPDLSYHGSRAWYPDMNTYTRHVGVFYCGEYARYSKEGKPDEDIFVAYNVHWEKHDFDLPRPSRKKIWKRAMITYCEEDFCITETEELENQKRLTVPPRSIVVLISALKEKKKEEEF